MAARGMGGQLTRNARPQAKRSSLVAAMQRSSVDHEQIEVPLADLAENPANPAARATDDLAELAESIREVGIVTALTVVPTEDWLRRHPEHGEAVGERRYVIMAGHRRRAAGMLAGQTHAPVMVRPDLAEYGVADVQLHENLHRLALTPLQEARAYARKVDEGYSQRQIAAAVKVSQGQVNKRLSLLNLPEGIQTAVDEGWYTVADALTVLKHDQDVIDEVGERVSALTAAENELVREELAAEADLSHTEALARRSRIAAANYQLRLTEITRAAINTVTSRRRRAAAEARAEELGAKFIESPHEKFRGQDHTHEVRGRDVERHAKKGNLAVAPGFRTDEPRYYALAKDNPKQQAATSAEPDRQTAERRTRKARSDSRKARISAIAGLVTRKPTALELREALVRHLLAAPTYDSNAKGVARKIAIEAGVGPEGTDGYWDWMQAVNAEHDAGRREQLAWILTWAAREEEHHSSTNYTTTWGERDIAYYDDLCESTGYEPGEWEQEQLAGARRRTAQLDKLALTDTSDDETEVDQ